MLQVILYSLILQIQANIYSIQFTDNAGVTRSFQSFQGKRILLVNMASQSSYVNQLAQLQQLQEQYHDSLAIIVFPSNSFGNEPLNNSQIQQLCVNTYQATYLIAQKGNTQGDNQLPIFQWLTTKALNGFLDIPVKGDFQKYLIDENGEIKGVFASDVNPLDPEISNAITQN